MSLPKWKARNFVITIDAKLVKEKALIKRFKEALTQTHFVRYVVGQLEVGSSGYKHWQIYVECHAPQQSAKVLKWLSPTNADKINIDKRKGSRSDARYYCMKDAEGKYDESFNWPGHEGRPKGTKFHEFGHWKPDKNSRKVAISKLNEVIDNATSFQDVINNDDISGTLKGSMNYARARFHAKPLPVQEEVQLRAWQIALMNEVVGTPDPRKIIWYVDEEGGKGKTFMSRFLVSNHQAVVLGGKEKDMFYAYKNEPIVIFDLSRGKVNRETGQVHTYDFSYEGMESIKDGLYFNSKYEAGMRYRAHDCHIIVFSNGYPDMDALSMDRWDIRSCSIGTPSAGVDVITHDAVPVPDETPEEANIDKPLQEWYW